MTRKILGTALGATMLLALPGTALAAAAPATIGGVASSTQVSLIGEAHMKAAVAQAPTLPITSAETLRLRWLAAGNLRQMTLYDATIASQIASLPLTMTSDTTTPLTSVRPTLMTPDVNVGTCWYGNQNQKTYSGLLGNLTVDAGITGYCDGPGGKAIVARGNYEAGANGTWPDACNAAPTPVWHAASTNYYGGNPQLIEMLNTYDSGYGTPFGCAGDGSSWAAADWVNYQGYYGPYNYIGLGWGQPGWGSDTAIAGPYTCCSTVTNN